MLFQQSPEPLFLVNQQQRILSVNRAWEECLGIAAAAAQGLICRSRVNAGDPPAWKVLAGVLCPPAEVWEGRPGQVRRPVVRPGLACEWWDIDFLPLRSRKGRLRVLGKISRRVVEDSPDRVPLPETLAALRERFDRQFGLEPLQSTVPAIRRMINQVRLATASQIPILLCGEPGSGKSWIARVIHQQGVCRERSFAAVDCALCAKLVDGILFGAGGLLTTASIGTLYLRNITDLPRELQERLSEWANESATAQPRLIAGCAADPLEAVRAGQLLESLHCVLGTLVIAVPPLRERLADLPQLLERLLARTETISDGASTIAPAALDVLHAYPWPGNIRELFGVVTRAKSRVPGKRIDACDLPLGLRLATGLQPDSTQPARPSLPLDVLLERVERRLMALALRKAQGNKSRAADYLSIWRARLIRRMEVLKLDDIGTNESG